MASVSATTVHGLTDDEEDCAIGALIEGLGVEDIAVQFGCRVDAVRAFVRSLRASGLLREVVAQAREREGGAE